MDDGAAHQEGEIRACRAIRAIRVFWAIPARKIIGEKFGGLHSLDRMMGGVRRGEGDGEKGGCDGCLGWKASMSTGTPAW
jgi:hypothetical protein